MLNYISAEWYKLRHTKGGFIAFGLLLTLVAMLFLPAFWYGFPDVEAYTAAYLTALFTGFFLAPLFAARAFDDQYGRGTMKNEVVFGISRPRIYLGKLLFGGLVGTGAAFLTLGFYLLLCLLTGREGLEATLMCLDICVQGTLLALPLWLAGLSLAFFLLTLIRSSLTAVSINYLILFFAAPLSMTGFGEAAYYSPVNYFFDRLFFVAPIRGLYGAIDQQWEAISGMGYSWLVGLGWIAVTTLAGMAVFSRREIN